MVEQVAQLWCQLFLAALVDTDELALESLCILWVVQLSVASRTEGHFELQLELVVPRC